MNLPNLRDWLKGEHGLVVAPGPSSLEVPTERFYSHWTIGCNRALPYCFPDFAVCIETGKNPAWRVVQAHRPLVTFTHLGDSPPCPVRQMVRISMNVNEWLPFDAQSKLFLGMSPFFAAAVGVYMGMKRVGLVGVDLHRNHYPQQKFRDDFEDRWTRLVATANHYGTELVNLNPTSSLQAVPKAGWETMRAKGCGA